MRTLIIDDYALFYRKEQTLEEEGRILEDAPYRNGCDCFWIVACSRWTKSIKRQSAEENVFSHFPKGLGRPALDAIHPITTRTMTQFFSQMPMVKVEADRWKKQGATVIVLVDDAKRAQKVEQTFADFEIKSVDFKREGTEGRATPNHGRQDAQWI